MIILALESSATPVSAAVLDEEHMLAEYTLNHKKTHSQTLLPMVDEVLAMAEIDKTDLSAVAISEGPGSFTGLRIGSATAKGIGLALSIPLIPVPTLEALACNAAGFPGLIVPMLDARREHVFTGLYRTDGVLVKEVLAPCVLPVEELTKVLNERGEEVMLLGDGAVAHGEKLAASLTVPYAFAGIHQNDPRAASVGALALAYLRNGKTVPASEHVPVYLRMTQAERERMEKEGKL